MAREYYERVGYPYLGLKVSSDNRGQTTIIMARQGGLLTTAEVALRVHSPVQDTQDLQTSFTLRKHDDVALSRIGVYAGMNFRSFVPERFVAAQPF